MNRAVTRNSLKQMRDGSVIWKLVLIYPTLRGVGRWKTQPGLLKTKPHPPAYIYMIAIRSSYPVPDSHTPRLALQGCLEPRDATKQVSQPPTDREGGCELSSPAFAIHTLDNMY
jgi:hypothetical protein